MELTQLGQKVGIPASPLDAILECIKIENPEVKKSVVRFSCPEFTSLCPITKQPDFARFYIDFIPYDYLVESKSLKLYLASFRNHGGFHEEVTAMIGERIRQAIRPQWIRVVGAWFPRGGIPIDVIWQDGRPGDIEVPELPLTLFTGR